MKKKLSILLAIFAIVLQPVFAFAGFLDGHTQIMIGWIVIGCAVSAVPGIFSFIFAKEGNIGKAKLLPIIALFAEIPFFIILSIFVANA